MRPSHCDHEHGVCNCGHHHDDDEDDMVWVQFYIIAEDHLVRKSYKNFVNHWPKSVVRAKGIVWFDDPRETVCLYLNRPVYRFLLLKQGKWLTAFPKEQQELYLKEYPEAKKNWDDVYGDREIKLVFIGQHGQGKVLQLTSV